MKKIKPVSSWSSSRRDFIKKSALAFGAITIVPRHVLGGQGYLAPSDTLTKAIIGVGGMGRGHYEYEGTRLVAVCDVDQVHLKEAIDLAGGKVKAILISGSYWLNPISILFTSPHLLIGMALCQLWLHRLAKMYGVRNQ
jgi:hypothetical protein